jgi:hypothetical protein
MSRSISGKRGQRGFFAAGLGLALFAVFAATGWGVMRVADAQQPTVAGGEAPTTSAASEPAGKASTQ